MLQEASWDEPQPASHSLRFKDLELWLW